MAEDRMLNDEILLGLIKANSGGGGGGTTNYNQLENKPQIAGTELQGNKTLADLGIASAQSVESITNGESINTFAGVETALDGVATALATKQNATDNSLETDAKTIVGAINEHEGDISTLKSGFTNLDNEVNGDATVYPYADVITIEDAVPSNLADCSVKIEPVQDLHGQSAPYVGGAGKNKLPLVLADIKANNTDGTWNDNVYTINNGTITVYTDDGGNVTGIKANGTFNATTVLLLWRKIGSPHPFDSTSYKLNGCSNGSENTYKFDFIYRLSGADQILAANFDGDTTADFSVLSDATIAMSRIVIYAGTLTNQMFYPMVRLATETDSTFAPYTNICPISGHTEVDVQRDGKNLVEGTIVNCNINSSGLIGSEENLNVSYGRVFANKQYTISSDDAAGAVYAFYTDVPIKTSASYNGTRTVSNNKTFTAPIDGYVAFRTSSSYTQAQLELGSTATTYEPYQGKTYTIALGDTIYGGTVDFDSGVMMVTHKFVDLGDYTWYTLSNNQFYTEGINDFAKESSGTTQYATDYICDKYVSVNGFVDYTYISLYYNTSYSGYRCFVRNDPNTTSISTGADFKTYITGTHLCYELATPFTIQLTPQQIQLLQGQNTLTASTGQISVTTNGVSGSIGSVQEQVNGLAEEVAEIKPLNYSTTEQKTGQKWIDGKDIYFNTFEFPEPIEITNSAWVSLGISATGIDTLINAVLHFPPTGIRSAEVRIDDGVVKAIASRTGTFEVSCAILYYTKTTT